MGLGDALRGALAATVACLICSASAQAQGAAPWRARCQSGVRMPKSCEQRMLSSQRAESTRALRAPEMEHASQRSPVT